MSQQIIVITHVPGYYNNTFSHVIGKPIVARKEPVISGWKVSVKIDVATNPRSIWTEEDITELYISAQYARPATAQEIADMQAELTGKVCKAIADRMLKSFSDHVRATSRDNPFRHWNRIKGNRKVGMPEVYTMKELRA